jgi:hypothetical protein
MVGVLLLACGGGSDGSSKRGLSQACSSDGDCAAGHCQTVFVGQVNAQCTGDNCASGGTSYCQQFDSLAVCLMGPAGVASNFCVESCTSSSDCPGGASCLGGGCYQN